MSLQFTPRAHFLMKSAYLRPNNQGKWSIRWTFRRSLSNKSINGGTSTRADSSLGQHLIQTNPKKGKLSKFRIFHTKWSWKVGAGWTLLQILDWWLLAAGGWLSWSGLLTRWTPIGIGIFTVIEWHLHNSRLQKMGLPKTASNFQMKMYCSLPLRLLSRCWGWVADCSVPTPLRPHIYGLYAKVFQVNMDEAANENMKEYRSLTDFFTRPLKDGVRIVDEYSSLVSPADGKVLNFGSASSNQIEQVKGITYKIDYFLGPDNWTQKQNQNATYLQNIKEHQDEKTSLYQCVIYLAPGDYHRFHSPAEWAPVIRRHFTGELLSVSPKIAEWIPGLFCINERAVYIGRWKHGFFSFTAVGATNVGSVQIYFDEQLKTNKWLGLKVKAHNPDEYSEFTLPRDIKLSKGEIVGQFNMGSTIVLIFEAPKDFKFTIVPGQKIKVGEPLGRCGDEPENGKKKNPST